MPQAAGTFDVKLTPQPTDDSGIGRMTAEKHYHGDLDGTAKGQMLTAMTSVKESAGYVAEEKVTGALRGRKGSFMLQHTGVMTRGTPHLNVTIVPDSGTGELAGIAGSMTIQIEAGVHRYVIDYTLPDGK